MSCCVQCASCVASTVALNVTYLISVWLVPPRLSGCRFSSLVVVSVLAASPNGSKTKQNETNQNKNTQQVRFSICVILLSVVIFYEYITTPKAMHTHTDTHTQTDTHTCMHICQCKCVSAWLHRCHQFYLTSVPFRITRFNVSLKCVNELTIRGSQAPLSPPTHSHLCTARVWGHKLGTIHTNNDRP